MSFYRIVNCEEIKKALKIGYWSPSDRDQEPYKAGEVIFIFEFQDSNKMIKKYGSTIANNRDEKDKIYILIFDINKDDVEIDESQSGWPESRVYRGFVDFDKIQCIGYCNVICSNPGNYRVSELTFYDKYKPIEVVCE